MLQRKIAKKLRLSFETLEHVSDPTDPGGGSISSPGCTVLTTCSPDCCDTNAPK